MRYITHKDDDENYYLRLEVFGASSELTSGFCTQSVFTPLKNILVLPQRRRTETVCMRLGWGGNFLMNDIQDFTAGH